LVEACRFLADHVVAAWTREGKLESLGKDHIDPLMHARRLVSQKCLYGVDKNESAVELAKLSLWLVTLAKELPFTFVDHALRHGDSLVGLDFEQLRSFHWKPSKQLELFNKELDAALDEAIGLRQRILQLADKEDRAAQREKERLLWDAEDALDRVRLIGDLVVGAFFAHEKDKDRETERVRRLDLVKAWLSEGGAAPEELLGMQGEIRARTAPFHWMVEFPEIFYAGRPDPLDNQQVNRAAYMDAFVGNPPFAGKNTMSEEHGALYLDWLMETRPEVKGRANTDLCAYFFRRAADLLGLHGTIGFLATNTIAQGDTRLIALKALIDGGAEIYEAEASRRWPGDAAVTVAIVHLAFGAIRQVLGPRHLDNRSVPSIDSRLQGRLDRPECTQLAANADLAFLGGKLIGMGLAVTLSEYDELIAIDPNNATILRPYLGGEDVNQNPRGNHDRYMIDFTSKTLEEARAWPTLLQIAEEKVRPVREKDKRGTYKTYWWRPGESGGAMYAALKGFNRCLVTAYTTKHLMFSFQPSSVFFANSLYVFPFDSLAPFASLQSRVHEAWTRLLSSSMKTDLRYAASDCFETFPFPQPNPRTALPALETIGRRLYDTRAAYLLAENVGLTITYNRIKDPANQEPRIHELRRLHEEMDRAVLDAYGWTDIEVPPYCPLGDDDKKQLARFDDEVIDRLFVLNAQRAEEEKRKGLAAGAKQKGAGKAAAKKGPKKSGKADEQLGLLGKDDE
ncbi:MAG: type IIL restriction-modification enzyme MmeI, partial [Byssovorax sp.]